MSICLVTLIVSSFTLYDTMDKLSLQCEKLYSTSLATCGPETSSSGHIAFSGEKCTIMLTSTHAGEVYLAAVHLLLFWQTNHYNRNTKSRSHACNGYNECNGITRTHQ